MFSRFARRLHGRLARPGDEGTVAIGLEMAQAREAEARHRSRADHGPSPLEGVRYEAARGEHSLHRYVPSATDEDVRAVVREYTGHDEPGRARMRAALTADDFYVLIGFARRSTLAALRAGEPAPLRDAAGALAAVESERVDYRDVTWAAALVSWAMLHLGLDSATALREAAALAEPATASILLRFASEPVQDLDAWGYRYTETANGPALIDSYGARSTASEDLVGLGTRLADALEADVYGSATVTTGVEIAEVWLRGGGDPAAVRKALKKVRGAVSVSADLDPAVDRHAESQMLLTFIGEARNEEHATLLAGAAGAPDDRVVLGVAEGRLFCLLVAGSFDVDAPAYETADTLARFEAPITAALRSAGAP